MHSTGCFDELLIAITQLRHYKVACVYSNKRVYRRCRVFEEIGNFLRPRFFIIYAILLPEPGTYASKMLRAFGLRQCTARVASTNKAVRSAPVRSASNVIPGGGAGGSNGEGQSSKRSGRDVQRSDNGLSERRVDDESRHSALTSSSSSDVADASQLPPVVGPGASTGYRMPALSRRAPTILELRRTHGGDLSVLLPRKLETVRYRSCAIPVLLHCYSAVRLLHLGFMLDDELSCSLTTELLDQVVATSP